MSEAVKLSTFSKQEGKTWVALVKNFRRRDNAVESTRGGNSYPVVSRWSQNDEGFAKSGISKRCEIGIVRRNDRGKCCCRGGSKRCWYEGRNSAYHDRRVYNAASHKGDKGSTGSRSSRRGVKYCGHGRDRSLLMDSQKQGWFDGKRRWAYEGHCHHHQYGERSRSNHETGLKKVVREKQLIYHRAGG